MSTGEQLVVMTRKDLEELIPYLQIIKDNTTLDREKKVAGSIIHQFKNKLAIWDKSVERKQVLLKPSQLRMVSEIRDIFTLELSPQLARWQAPHKNK